MYKTILHATDLSENHFDLCQKSVKLAKDNKADLYFLHVIETPASLQWAHSLGFAELATPVTDDAKTVMGVLGETFDIPTNHLIVEIGSAYVHILNKVKALNCDLVVLGAGSTANAVLHHAGCDVLILR